jgi:ParB-like chromosome segregation protein Spo0J
MVRSLVENMQRVELNHADAAAAVMKLYREYGKDEAKVRRVTGLSIRRIRDYIQVDLYASPETKRRLKSRDVKLVDVKRALRAANYEPDKADRLLKKMKEHQLTTYQKKTLVEFGEANPNASVDDIVKQAEKPRIDYSALMINIPEHLHDGLTHAARAYALEPEEMIVKALSEWLSDQGFVSGKKAK